MVHLVMSRSATQQLQDFVGGRQRWGCKVDQLLVFAVGDKK